MLSACDLNNDGQIDYQEFIQAAVDHEALLSKDNIRIVFNMFDKDGDNNVTVEELK